MNVVIFLFWNEFQQSEDFDFESPVKGFFRFFLERWDALV